MSRRDTILIAVLINCGLLAILFMMAMQTDQADSLTHSDKLGKPLATSETVVKEKQKYSHVTFPHAVTRDAWNQVAKETTSAAEVPSVVAQGNVEKKEKKGTRKTSSGNYVEVTVKRGDYLEKIARANETTVSALMEANSLPTARIRIGQVLRVPVDVGKDNVSDKDRQQVLKSSRSSASENTPQYYTLKSGDNPWKIAKKFHVKFDELLEMNTLDEERARSLKPGDILRVE